MVKDLAVTRGPVTGRHDDGGGAALVARHLPVGQLIETHGYHGSFLFFQSGSSYWAQLKHSWSLVLRGAQRVPQTAQRGLAWIFKGINPFQFVQMVVLLITVKAVHDLAVAVGVYKDLRLGLAVVFGATVGT